jgi:putative spermidine/putrescine transport system substrate-binding protein
MKGYRVILPGMAVAALLATTAISTANEITITSWGGAYAESQRKAYYEPFMAATGVKVIEDEWNGDMAKVRAMVETSAYTSNLIDAESNDVVAGCDEGILESIDLADVGMTKDDFLPGTTLECGVPTTVWSTNFAFNKEVFSGEQPTGWKDFFDLKTFPGKRGMEKTPIAALEAALVADGVAPADVYTVLRTTEGVDRAFAKLDTIKASIIWWESMAQAPQLLADKEVVMSSGSSGRFYTAIVNDKRPFEMVWEGQISDFEYWVIPKGHPNKEVALQIIKFAVQPEHEAVQTTYIPYGPLRVGAEKFIDPKILPFLPSSPENRKNWIKSDTAFWADNLEQLQKRFQVWAAQ